MGVSANHRAVLHADSLGLSSRAHRSATENSFRVPRTLRSFVGPNVAGPIASNSVAMAVSETPSPRRTSCKEPGKRVAIVANGRAGHRTGSLVVALTASSHH